MNLITNHVLIRSDETAADIIADICDDLSVGPNEPFCFGAIMLPDKEDPEYYKLRMNCITPPEENPYTPTELILTLLSQPEPANRVRYVQPPLEQWLEAFRPYLLSIASRVHPLYEKLIPDREEVLSILYLCVVRLHRQGYYLHNTLIKKTLINELNLECRKLKGLQNTDSLDAPIGEDDDGKSVTLLDQIADDDSTEWARSALLYTEDDYWADMYEKIKARMLQDMSPLAFERILIQLKTHTVDRNTSYLLDKYRQIFNPKYTPRPNAKGQAKHKEVKQR